MTTSPIRWKVGESITIEARDEVITLEKNGISTGIDRNSNSLETAKDALEWVKATMPGVEDLARVILELEDLITSEGE